MKLLTLIATKSLLLLITWALHIPSIYSKTADAYQTLGVSPKATLKEIRQAYRKLALEL